MHASKAFQCRRTAGQSVRYLQHLTAWRRRPLGPTPALCWKRASSAQATIPRDDNNMGWESTQGLSQHVKSKAAQKKVSGGLGMQQLERVADSSSRKGSKNPSKRQSSLNSRVQNLKSPRLAENLKNPKQQQLTPSLVTPASRSKKSRKSSLKPFQHAKESKSTPELKTADYMLRNLTFPTAKDYPSAPSTIDSSRHVFVKELILQGFLDVQKTMSHTGPPNARIFKCELTTRIGNHETFVSQGEGKATEAAFRAAQLHLLATAHSKGFLQEYWYPNFQDMDDAISQLGSSAQPFQIMPPKDGNEKDLKTETQLESGAKGDVYNYVARFGTIPSIVLVVQEARYQRKILQYYVASVSFPAHNITATAASRTRRIAETKACMLFKQMAEKYQADSSSTPMVVKDSESINSSNAQDFLELYRSTQQNEKIRLDINPDGTMWKGQALINDISITEPCTMSSKKKAEALTTLILANTLKNRKPELFEMFLDRLRAGSGQARLPLPTQTMNIDSDCLLVMRRAIVDARRAGLPDIREDLSPEEDLQSYGMFRGRNHLSPAQLQNRNKELLEAQQIYGKDSKTAELKLYRSRLPIVKHTTQIEEMISNNLISIIIGSTGSGKTTQIPQILLDSAIAKNQGASCNIICTQPRRIAAVSVAQRVAVERNEPFQESVGHQVRFDSKPAKRGGSITYCTAGVLLKQLQHHPDQTLDGITHVVIDEVHERSTISDFLLIMLKNLVISRLEAGKTMPKIILMSATMDMEKFSNYFAKIVDNGKPLQCPSITVPGRTFPVQEKFFEDIIKDLKDSNPITQAYLQNDPQTLEYMDSEAAFISQATGRDSESGQQIGPIDWKKVAPVVSKSNEDTVTARGDGLVPIALVAATIAHVAKTTDEGAILVFLPGIQEIRKVEEQLREKRSLGLRVGTDSDYKVFMLHSSLPDAQIEVFKQSTPGCRKIILATNIAETSLTIPDAQYVIDTGKAREKQYDQVRQITSLPCTWISKSSSRQRSGRAGRVQDGHYFALFSRPRFESFKPIGSPEILRSDLQEVCLSTKIQAPDIPIKDFLSQAMDAPSPLAVDASIKALQSLEALTMDEALTPLGKLLEALPVHPRLGKMIVLGIVFRCLDPMLILAAMAGEREMFVAPIGQKKLAYQSRVYFGEGSASDHVAAINAFRSGRKILAESGWRAAKDWALDHNIHFTTLKSIDSTISQIAEILINAGLIPQSLLHGNGREELGGYLVNENADNISLIKALALAGMQPNLAVSIGGTSFRTPVENHARVPQTSIAASQLSSEKHPFGTLLTYHSLIKSPGDGRVTLRECAQVTPLLASLFGGSLKAMKNELTVDNWLNFQLKPDPYEHLSQPVREMYWKEGEAIKTVVEFRKSLDRLLTAAFRDLNANRGSQRSGSYLAEDRTREAFAQGLVAVLDRDIGVRARR